MTRERRELETFRDHARRMAAGKRPRGVLSGPAPVLDPETRRAWARLADEAQDHLDRDRDVELDLGLPTSPSDEEPGLW